MRNREDFDVESNTYSMSEESDRRSFISKVYMILTIQLLVTLGIVALFVFNDEVQQLPRKYPALLWVAVGVTFVLVIVLSCCENVRRKSPLNYICLGIFTLSMSLLLGIVSSVYAPQQVLMALGITAAITFALTIFAMQTKCDFTACGGVILVLVIVLVVFGLITMFFPIKIMVIIHAAAGVLIFSFCLIYDTQLMLGGKHKYAFDPEDYVFAALTLYLDIVNLFMYLLQLIGVLDD